jgi:hypothetical protein
MLLDDRTERKRGKKENERVRLEDTEKIKEILRNLLELMSKQFRAEIDCICINKF